MEAAVSLRDLCMWTSVTDPWALGGVATSAMPQSKLDSI